jgi:hypothetical protein
MANLADARILAATFYQHHDHNAPPLDRMPQATQEAWLLVAAAARMLDSTPEPVPHLQSGHLYMARWHERDSWRGDVPRRPTIICYMGAGSYIIDPGEPPIIEYIASPAASSISRIPGLIYDPTPLT